MRTGAIAGLKNKQNILKMTKDLQEGAAQLDQIGATQKSWMNKKKKWNHDTNVMIKA